MKASKKKSQQAGTAAAELQKFFYPVHYQIGMALEDALRNGMLTRKQSAILWMIHSAGQDGRSMPRKEIVRLMQSWFEVTNSGLSKAIRGMARPPLSLVQISEDPHSAREKVVALTHKGERFVADMEVRGEAFLQQYRSSIFTRRMSRHKGIEFFQEWTARRSIVHLMRSRHQIRSDKRCVGGIYETHKRTLGWTQHDFSVTVCPFSPPCMTWLPSSCKKVAP